MPEAGATLEMRVKKAVRKGTSSADSVWKPVVFIEMKKRGEGQTQELGFNVTEARIRR